MLRSVTDSVALSYNNTQKDKENVRLFLRTCSLFLKHIYFADANDFMEKLTESIDRLNSPKWGLVIEKMRLQIDPTDPFTKVLEKMRKQEPRKGPTIENSSLPRSKPDLTIHLGDYLELATHIQQEDEDATVILQNAANPYHPGGCVTYGTGSAEEALARRSNLWLELILNSLTGERQRGALLELLKAIKWICERHENGEDQFFASPLFDTYKANMIRFMSRESKEEYWLNNTAEKIDDRCHVDSVFLIKDMDTLSHPISIYREFDFNFRIKPICVASVAGVDKRIIGTESVYSAIGWKVASEQTYKEITTQLILDTIDTALNQEGENNKYLIMLPLGCGAFGGNIQTVADCYVDALTQRFDAIRLQSLRIVMATFPDNYATLVSTFKNKLRRLMAVNEHMVSFAIDGPEITRLALPNPARQTISLVDMDATQPSALHVIGTSTITQASPQGLFVGKESLLGKLCRESSAFSAVCQTRIGISTGQYVDLGVFQLNENKLRVVVSALPQLKGEPQEVDVVAMMHAYTFTLLRISKHYERLHRHVNIGLSLFGTGYGGWKEKDVLEIALFVFNKLMQTGTLRGINSITFMQQGLKNLGLASTFSAAMEPEHAIPPQYSTIWDELITKSIHIYLNTPQWLEPECASLTANQHTATIFLSYYDKAEQEGMLLVTSPIAPQKKKSIFGHGDDVVRTPCRMVHSDDSVVGTALMALAGNVDVDYAKLLENYPGARFGKIGMLPVANNSYRHAYYLLLGECQNKETLMQQLDIIAVPEFSTGFVCIRAELEAPKAYKLPNTTMYKPLDKRDRILLEVFEKRMQARAAPEEYLLKDVISHFDMKAVFDRDNSSTASSSPPPSPPRSP